MNGKNILKTVLPLALILFLQVGIGAIDTWFLKRQGDLDLLAWFGLANGSYNSIGIIFSATFSVAGVYYSQFRQDAKRMEASFLLVALLLALIFIVVLQCWAFVWEPAEMRNYFRWRTIGIFPYLMVGGMRYIFAGDIKTHKMVPVFILGLSFKFLCNYLFYPVTTLKTVALLSSCTFWVIFLGLFLQYRAHVAWRVLSLAEIKRFILLGLPMGLMAIFDSCGLFGFSVVVKSLGIDAMSSHQIMIQGIFLTFAIPYSMNTIMAVIARDRGRDISSAFILFSGFVVSSLSLIAFLTWISAIGHEIDGVLLVLGGAFQFVNGMQTVFVGAIRGLEDVKFPPKVAFVAYWLVALPLSLYWVNEYGLQGVWVCMVIGQGIQFIAFSSRWIFLRKQLSTDLQNVYG